MSPGSLVRITCPIFGTKSLRPPIRMVRLCWGRDILGSMHRPVSPQRPVCYSWVNARGARGSRVVGGGGIVVW